MGGIEFAQELLRIRPDITILMTSGDVRSESAAAISNQGLPDLVLKPCTVDELEKLLDNLLRREPARRNHPSPRSEAKAASHN
jgi:DNA-binding NtrC family response regulator